MNIEVKAMIIEDKFMDEEIPRNGQQENWELKPQKRIEEKLQSLNTLDLRDQ